MQRPIDINAKWKLIYKDGNFGEGVIQDIMEEGFAIIQMHNKFRVNINEMIENGKRIIQLKLFIEGIDSSVDINQIIKLKFLQLTAKKEIFQKKRSLQQYSNDCPEGQFRDGKNVCQKCGTTSNCSVCADNANTSCLLCKQNSIGQPQYYGQKTTCSSSCSGTQYGLFCCYQGCQQCNATNKCTQCANSSQAYYVYKKACQACVVGGAGNKQLYGGVCGCIDNYYLNSADNCTKCAAINVNCLRCGPPATGCLICKTGFFLSSNTCSPCPANTWTYKSGNFHTYCFECDKSCNGCSDDNKDTSCTACASSPIKLYFYKAPDNLQRCIECNTAQGYFLISQICYKCGDNCQSCDQIKTTECNTCLSTYYFRPDTKTCDLCNYDSFFQNGLKQCLPCIQNCKQCSDSSTCEKCLTGYYIKGSVCDTCDTNNGFYINAAGTHCNQCHSNCLTCTDHLETSCNICKDSLIKYDNDTSGNLADDICFNCNQDNYFVDGNMCRKCTSNCQKCSNTTTCDVCFTNFYFDETGKCISCDVSKNYYLVNGTHCKACHTSCATCTDNAETSCTACASGYYKFDIQDTPGNNLDDICVQCDQSGQFLDSDSVCKKCNSSCLSCNSVSETGCLKCNTGLHKRDNKCIDCSSLDKTYIEGELCQDCHASCKKCSKGDDFCDKCIDGYSRFAGQCLDCTQKTDHYVEYSTNTTEGECTKCFESCATCQNGLETGCKTCKNNYYQFDISDTPENSSDDTCVQCNQLYQFIDTDQICKKCHSTCSTCSSVKDDGCQTCNTGYHKRDNKCIICTSLPKTYIEGEFCKDCDSACKACSTGNDLCDQCIEGYSRFEGRCIDCSQKLDYFVDFSVNTTEGDCKQCDLSCATCSNGTKTGCIKCAVDKYRLGDECVNCDQDFQYKLEQKCEPCESTCKTCSNGTNFDCIKCKDGLYKHADKTCQVCDVSNTSFFIEGEQCISCYSSCKTCKERLDIDCTECLDPNQKIRDKLNTCMDCPIGYYTSGTFCIQCHISCETCETGSDEKSCTKCKSGFNFQLDGTCSECTITNKFFIDISDRDTCKPCHNSCLTCHSGDIYDCDLCDGTFKKFKDKTCAECPNEGHYIQGERCFKCHSSCKNCDGELETQCSECKDNEYKSEKDGTCKTCKPEDKTYVDVDDKSICKECHSTCKQCSKGGEKGCTICEDNLYKMNDSTCQLCPDEHFYKEGEFCNLCDDSCLVCKDNTIKCDKCDTSKGYYFDQDKNCKKCDTNINYYISGEECMKCYDDCSTCTGGLQTNCKSCSNSEHKLMSDNSCQKCPEDKYFIIDDKCLQCEASCQKCDGPSNNQCTLCPDGQKLFQDKTCNLCPQEQYFVQDIFCLQCADFCKTCISNKLEDCSECIDPKKLHTDNICKDCPAENFYVDGVKCLACHENCLTCSNGDPTGCLTCKPQFKKMADGSCEACPPSKFFSDGINCLRCDESCETCSGPSQIDCLTCVAGKKIMPDKTCQECPLENYFIQDEQCIPCFGDCLTCSNKEQNNCTTCQAGLFLYPDNSCNKCEENHYFKDISNKLCKKCDTSCLTCNGEQDIECIDCEINKYMHVDNKCKECNIDDGFYIKDLTKCLNCHNDCKSCIDDQPDQCKECKPNLYFRDKICQICPSEHYYIDTINCKKCDDSCLKCSGDQPTQCLQCNDGQFINEETNICEICQVDNKYFTEGTMCKKCHVSCKKCSKQNECIICDDGLSFMEDGSCQICKIGDGYYSETGTNICKKCISECKVCSDQNACQVCKDGLMVRQDGTCGTCEVKEYLDQQGKCQNCDTTCAKCTGPNPTDCIQCSNASQFIRLDTSLCGECETNQYIDNHKCQNCHGDCTTCVGPLAKDCKACNDNSKYYCDNTSVIEFGKSKNISIECEKSCLACDSNCKGCFNSTAKGCLDCQVGSLKSDFSCSQCINGEFFDSNVNNCKKCSLHCQQCTAIDQCTQCKDGYESVQGKCLCPEGSFVDQESTQCKKCHTDCKACTNQKNTDCVICSDQDKFLNQNNLCVNKCDVGYTKHSILNKCVRCQYKIINDNLQCLQECPDSQGCQASCQDNTIKINNYECKCKDSDNKNPNNKCVIQCQANTAYVDFNDNDLIECNILCGYKAKKESQHKCGCEKGYKLKNNSILECNIECGQNAINDESNPELCKCKDDDYQFMLNSNTSCEKKPITDVEFKVSELKQYSSLYVMAGITFVSAGLIFFANKLDSRDAVRVEPANSFIPSQNYLKNTSQINIDGWSSVNQTTLQNEKLYNSQYKRKQYLSTILNATLTLNHDNTAPLDFTDFDKIQDQKNIPTIQNISLTIDQDQSNQPLDFSDFDPQRIHQQQLMNQSVDQTSVQNQSIDQSHIQDQNQSIIHASPKNTTQGSPQKFGSPQKLRSQANQASPLKMGSPLKLGSPSKHSPDKLRSTQLHLESIPELTLDQKPKRKTSTALKAIFLVTKQHQYL